MPGERSFQLLFETFGKLPACHAPSVNEAALEKLRNLMGVSIDAPGHCILLKAPRAGHGKTHLLTRLQHELGGSHEFIPVHASGGSGITPETVLDDTLRRLVRSLPAAGGLTVLDLIARRLFSTALQPLVRSGEVPCQDRDAALDALRNRPVETFDFHHPSAVTAHWARENFGLLGPRLALELSQTNGLPHRETAFWVDAMFHFSSTPVDNPIRVRNLASTVFEDPAAEQAAHQRLVSLLGLMGTMLRVVLVADELEGFSSDESAALGFASFVGALRQSVDRLEIILSINQDVWESAFLPRLSGGLADRLSEVTVDLEPLDREGMIALIESRAPGRGEEILAKLDPDFIPSHARGLVKEAASLEAKESTQLTDIKDLSDISTNFTDPDQWPKEPPLEAMQESLQAPETPQNVPSTVTENAEQVTSSEKEPEPTPEPSDSSFSPEAAIAAFTAFKAEAPPEDDLGGFLPPSEPFSEKPAVSVEEAPQSQFAAPATEATEANRPDEPNPFHMAPATVAPQPKPLETPPIATTPPQENPFQAAPAQETPLQAFQAAPPAAETPPAPQQAPATTPLDPTAETPPTQQEESKTDRVDDLLKQFRERYGKS